MSIISIQTPHYLSPHHIGALHSRQYDINEASYWIFRGQVGSETHLLFDLSIFDLSIIYLSESHLLFLDIVLSCLHSYYVNKAQIQEFLRDFQRVALNLEIQILLTFSLWIHPKRRLRSFDQKHLWIETVGLSTKFNGLCLCT